MGKKSCNRKNIWAARGVALALGLILAAAGKKALQKRGWSPPAAITAEQNLIDAARKNDADALHRILGGAPLSYEKIQLYYTVEGLGKAQALLKRKRGKDDRYYLIVSQQLDKLQTPPTSVREGMFVIGEEEAARPPRTPSPAGPITAEWTTAPKGLGYIRPEERIPSPILTPEAAPVSLEILEDVD